MTVHEAMVFSCAAFLRPVECRTVHLLELHGVGRVHAVCRRAGEQSQRYCGQSVRCFEQFPQHWIVGHSMISASASRI